MLKRILPPNPIAIRQLPQEEGISEATLHKWRSAARGKRELLPDADVGPECWSSRDKFAAVLETAALKAASEVIKKELGGDLRILSNREKTMLIVALKNRYKTPALLARLGLARSSYFYHRARMNLEDKDIPIRQAMKEAFESNHRCYGYRRLKAYMTRESISISEKVVRRLLISVEN